MKSSITNFVFAMACLACCVAAFAADADAEKQAAITKQAAIVARVISTAAKKLMPNAQSFKVTPNWADNPDVKAARALADGKRAALLFAVLDQLAKNDDVVFDKMKTNQYQVIASVLVRAQELAYLADLVPISENGIILKDYIDGEVADIKLVQSQRLPYGMYRAARKQRDDKRTMLLMSDYAFVSDYMTQLIQEKSGEASLPKSVANITTMVSFMNACINNLANLCNKL